MSTQQLPAAPAYRSSSMDGFLMRFTWMLLLVKWVKTRKDDPRAHVRHTARNIANVLTLARVIFAYPVAWQTAAALVWLNGHHSLINILAACGWIIALGWLFWTDAVDGTLSNQSGTRSRIGEAADPLADKLAIGCTVYFLVWAAGQILPYWLTATLVPVVILVVALDVASAVVTVGEELRAKLIQAPPAKTERWGKRKLFTQCVGAGLLIIGLTLVAAGLQWAGWALVVAALAILALAVVFAGLSVFYHWRNLAGRHLSHTLIALAAPLMGAASGVGLYRWLQEEGQAASLGNAAMATTLGSIVFLGALTLFYLPLALQLKGRQKAA